MTKFDGDRSATGPSIWEEGCEDVNWTEAAQDQIIANLKSKHF
jgi:hypothetical protein